MRRFIVFILLMTCFSMGTLYSAYLRDIPMAVKQPDGTVLQCFASGDEYFNYLHDKDGYTIIQHPQTGYYVYAKIHDGILVATEFVAGQYDPASKGLQPYALISSEEWRARRQAWVESVQHPQNRPENRDYIPNHGTLNNISIFIRFSDDPQFSNSYYAIDDMFNDVSNGAVSLRAYFRAASYGAIEIPTTFYPGHNGNTIISYQDIYPRSYFEPFNESTNPNGYTQSNRAEREFSLLERAVNYINTNFPVPSNLNIDYNEDGNVDNVCFIVKGGVGEWNSLLWPHQWYIYDRTVRINGKRVWTFNFQLADATSYFNTSMMCHEMNHSLGAPDLYHYNDNGDGINPVGSWDLMQTNTMPPQHCGAYMKMKYGHWIDYIPVITRSGTYTLNPLGSSTPTNVAYKIPTSDPNQFYVVEYRKKSLPFESGLPGSGLLVYRINSSFNGNSNYDPDEGIYDEVYIFRPDGTATTNGDLYQAHFGANVGRREFSPSTNPSPFFSDGIVDPNFRIYNITSAGNTISFSYDCPYEDEEDCFYIGDGGTDVSELFPTNSSYKYTLTQQIYSAEEIGTAGTINSIAFYNDGVTQSRKCHIYLVATDKTMFESNNDWVPVSNLNKVFSGTVTMTTGEWTIINFDTPFAYDGISNLALVTNDISGYCSEPDMNCRVFPGYYQSILVSNNYANYNATTPQNYTGSRRNFKNQIKMQITAPTGEAVVVGEEGTTSSSALPSYSYYKYALTQQIYTADEIGANGIINSIGFYNDGAAKTRIYDFYLVATNKTSFESNSDWIMVTDADKVFSGIVTMTAGNWTTIAFDKPFAYDGTSNLILVADDNTGSFTSLPHMSCRTYSASNQTLRIYSDNTDYDPVATNYTGVMMSEKNQIRIQVEGAGELFVIGDGGTVSHTQLPSFSYSKYSLSQQIYTAEEIGSAGVISSIGFYNEGETKTRTCDFYLMATDKTSFSDYTDWVVVAEENKVFSGEVTMTAGKWTMIEFDKPFVYDGISNLILVTDDNTGIYNNPPHMRCRVFNCSNQSIHVFEDNVNFDPLVPVNFKGYVSDVKNQIMMRIENVGEFVVIGDGGTDTNLNLPTCSFYNYSLTQQIYTAEEIGSSGIINSIAFYNDGATKTRNCDFYLVATYKTSFSDSTDWVTVTDDNKVFSGSVTMNAREWTVIELFKPFVYDGIANLVLVTDDNTGGYTNSPHMSCRVFEAPFQSMCVYSDDTNYNPDIIASYSGTISTVKNQVLFGITSSIVTQTVTLDAGWNWFSTYIEATAPVVLLQMLEVGMGGNGNYIESCELFSIEYLDGEWIGDLEEVGITNEQMYLIHTNAACTIQLQGLIANPANHEITIYPEWNWVGYPCSEEMTLGVALAGFVPEDGDQIESMEGYAEYLDGEWLGLETLKPGQGLLYYSNSTVPKTFTFPTSAQ